MKKLAVVIGLVLMFAALPVVMAQGGTIEIGQSVDGSLDDATATYQINLAEGQAVSITLDSEDFELLPGDPGQIRRSDRFRR